jgi:DNA-damage-inducible protein J
MTTTLRIDDNLKQDCDAIFEDLGLSLSGAVTLFLRQVVKQRAIPFAISCDKIPAFGYYPNNAMSITERAERAKRFAAELRESSPREWTLDEINAEISASRSGQ